MARRKRTRTQRMGFRSARVQIIEAANRGRIDPGIVKPYSMRTLQQAVCVVRRRKLVSDGVLVAAGFRPRSHILPKGARAPGRTPTLPGRAARAAA